MIQMAWECDDCGERHNAPADCCRCDGIGYGEGGYCNCPTGEQLSAEDEREWAWLLPHVRRSEAARRRGDIEEAERIKHDVLRHDSPFGPVSRRAP